MAMLTNLANIARRTGYPVVEVPGWKTRGHGQMSTVQTITCHHTAGPAAGDYPSLATVRDGRLNPNPALNLPGPLAQLGVGRAGTIYVIAAGLSYHAGFSRETAYTNPHAIGIEGEATGRGLDTDWPDIQVDAYARLCAALVDAHDLTVADVRGHKETCSPPGRKVDPDFDMAAFRHRVAAVNLKVAPAQKETDMQWTDQVKLTAVDAEIWGGDYKEGDKVTFGLMVRYPTLSRKIQAEQTAQGKQIDALTKQVATLTGQLADAVKLLQARE